MKPTAGDAAGSSQPTPDQGVRVPVWFTVAQALKVVELKNLDHVLVEERGRIRGLASRRALSTAPSDDLVGRWTTRVHRAEPDSGAGGAAGGVVEPDASEPG